MSRNPIAGRLRPLRVIAMLATLFTLAAMTVPLLSSAATAETPVGSVPVNTTVTANGTPYSYGQTINGGTNGETMNIHVDATAAANGGTASSIFGVEARECAVGQTINNLFDFSPTQGGKCANVALGAGDLHNTVATAPPNTTADLTFNIGEGTTTFLTQSAVNVTITCDPTHPCKLVLQLSIPGGTDYISFPVNFAGQPDAPTGVTGTPGDTTADLSWTAPVNTGNSPIDHYVVTPTSPAGPSFNTPSATPSTHITGLTDFTPYSYTVQTHNAAGQTSIASAPVTVTPVPVPATITGAQAGNGQVTVVWTAASGSPTGYTVTSVPADSSVPCNTTVLLTCAVTSLTNGHTYQFIVTAHYAGGNSPSALGPVPGVTPLSNFGSVSQTFSVTKPAGQLVIGEACSLATGGPYPDKPYLGVAGQNCNVTLSPAVYDPAHGDYTSGGNIDPVTVRDLRDTDVGWHVDASLTPFTDLPATDTFGACALGFTPAAAGLGSVPPYVQNTTPGAAVAPDCTLATNGYGSSHTVANGAAGGGLGDSNITGPVAVNIPLAAHSGTYTAVMTFTLFTN